MTEHLSTQNLEQYRRRALSPAELLRADDHLAACEDCRLRAAEGGQPELILRALDANLRADALSVGRDHLPFEQLAALVDGQLGAAAREIAETHLELCHLCTEEVEDLRSYQTTFGSAPEARSRKAVAGKPTFAESLNAFWRLFAVPSPLRLAAAVLVLASVSLLGVFMWRQARTMPEVAEGTRQQPSPEDVSRPSDNMPSEPPPASGAASPGGSPDSDATTTPTVGDDAATTQIAVALDDAGGRVTLNVQGKIEGIPTLSPAVREAVKSALVEGRVKTAPVPAELKGRRESLMGSSDGAESFVLLGPAGKIVRDARPRLSWRPLAGASRYTVTILDADLKPVATSPPLSGTSWVVPRRLQRGRIYNWQVSALKDGEEIIAPAAPAPPARFKILEAAREDELSSLERDGARRSHLALGVFYARAGLLDEAEREFSALARANPRSDTARRLLNSVRASRRGKR